MQKVVIQIDEMKPHQAEAQGFLKEVEGLGFKNIRLTGDHDTKVTRIYGEVEDYEIAKEKFHNSIFEPIASLFPVG